MQPRRPVVLAATLAAYALAASSATAAPIPEGPDAGDAPAYIGAPAVQQPVFAPQPPRHPFMAPNERSNLHVDGFQTDTNTGPGPLGRDVVRVSTFQSADCASVTFDARGRIVAVCVGLQGPTLYLFDPRTLATLASFALPPRQPALSTGVFTDFGGGGYFYLDDHDRAVIPTTTRHVLVVGETDGPGFAQQRDYDLTGVLAGGDEILSALPDWSGRLWAVSKAGVVATVDPASGAVRATSLGEAVGNSIAVDDTGAVYVVTDAALYRFTAGAGGAPAVVWRAPYANDGRSKPGQTEVGSGTTPTVMTTGPWVAITDNADPIDVAVFDRTTGAPVCTVPVFTRGASATDQSLVAVGDALFAENNFGYSGPAATERGATTTPGIERVDVDPDGHGCTKRWHSDEIAPSVVPKASLANGLLYTYTKPAGETSDPWYLTALDLRTGRTVYRVRAGAGLGFNNNYAPITLGPDGTAYVGTLGGLVGLRDAVAPPQVPQSAAGTPSRAAPRLALRLRVRRDGRGCARRSFTAAVAGADAALVRSVRFRYAGARSTDGRGPRFSARFRLAAGTRARTLEARVLLVDGRSAVLRAGVTGARRCAGRRAPRFAG